MKAINLLLLAGLIGLNASAQEFNIGVHLDPGATVPFVTKHYSNSSIKTGVANFSYDAGLNLNFRYKRIDLELAPSLGQKMVQFHERLIDHTYNGEADYFLKYKSKVIEIPFLIGYRINKGNKNKATYLQAGASLEHTKLTTATTNTHSTGVSTITAYPLSTTTPDKTQSIINIVAGIKANAVIKRFGLIEYGLYYHYPLTAVGSYDFQTTVVSSTGSSANYVASYYVRQSFIELKLCYYLWNMDSQFKRLRYGHSQTTDTILNK